MSVIAQVKNGQIVESAARAQEETKKANSSLDKDAFLQLLVAQMKYQDPLQPTSNTEYISQLATFSQLEEMQNLTSGMTLQRASMLVGQYVFMKTTDSNGNTTYPEGYVDYVVYENNKAYLSINETLYSIDDLETVANAAYVEAADLAEKFVAAMDKLPKPEHVSRSDGEDIGKMIIVYENMSEYERGFLDKETIELYNKYVDRHQTLIVEPITRFMEKLNELPAADELTADNLKDMEIVVGTYEDFTAYQQALVGTETLAVYEAVKAKYDELKTE